MTASSLVPLATRRALWIASLILAGAAFTFGFACALPLAALAAVAALTSGRRDALALTAAIWLVNQAIGFAFLHYPSDAATLLWGGALLVVALLSCEAAGLAARRMTGALAHVVAFLVAFAVYEGSLFAIGSTISETDDFAVAIVARVFLVNACAFVVLWAWSLLAVTIGARRKPAAGLSVRAV